MYSAISEGSPAKNIALNLSTSTPWLMAEVANIAGGLVCEEVGTVAINKERLLHECGALL